MMMMMMMTTPSFGIQVMTCRPRSDLCINLPALRKLDNMLLVRFDANSSFLLSASSLFFIRSCSLQEILDSFSDPEFWYVDQGILAPDSDGSASFRRNLHRQEEKWWLPVPRVPPGGLHEKTRKELQHKRECTSQILKAAMAINSNSLAEMEVPESYLSSLPKVCSPAEWSPWVLLLVHWLDSGSQNGRASLGDVIYRYVASDQFSPECLLDCLDLSSEHRVLEVANRVEASIYIWRRRAAMKPASSSTAKSSWEIVKDMIVDADKRELLAERAETLLLCLKQRFPSLTQTSLDTSKIQFNKVGASCDSRSRFGGSVVSAFLMLSVAGHRQIHSGKLLQSSGEPRVQHRGPHRWFAPCGRLLQALGSAVRGSSGQHHRAEEGDGACLRHSMHDGLCDAMLLAGAAN